MNGCALQITREILDSLPAAKPVFGLVLLVFRFSIARNFLLHCLSYSRAGTEITVLPQSGMTYHSPHRAAEEKHESTGPESAIPF